MREHAAVFVNFIDAAGISSIRVYDAIELTEIYTW